MLTLLTVLRKSSLPRYTSILLFLVLLFLNISSLPTYRLRECFCLKNFDGVLRNPCTLLCSEPGKCRYWAKCFGFFLKLYKQQLMYMSFLRRWGWESSQVECCRCVLLLNIMNAFQKASYNYRNVIEEDLSYRINCPSNHRWAAVNREDYGHYYHVMNETWSSEISFAPKCGFNDQSCWTFLHVSIIYI